MGRLCKLVKVGLLLCLLLILTGVPDASAETPFITLYRGQNLSGTSVTFNSSHENFYELDLNDRVHSFRCHGNFILYDYTSYNQGLADEGYATMMHSQDATITQGTNDSLATVSSVRFIGSYVNESHVPSITLFRSPNFSGRSEEVMTVSKARLESGGFITSAISVGVHDWTFYDEINFNGEGLCLKGSSNYTGVKLYPDTRKDDVFIALKKSVEVGCWARHGVPVHK